MSIIKSGHGLVVPARDDDGPDAALKKGSYGYLFRAAADAEALAVPHGPEAEVQFAKLDWLGSVMDEHSTNLAGTPLKSELPAIYTYFGQFLNHDLSAPTGTGELVKEALGKVDRGQADTDVINNDPDLAVLTTSIRPPGPDWVLENILNEHRFPLVLDSVYGNGPFDGSADVRDLYETDDPIFFLGQTVKEPNLADLAPNGKTFVRKAGPDLLRDREKNEARIADLRNDENLILSQLHLAFLLFHNRVVERLKPGIADKKTLFIEARQLVTWHYQWCILHDYLEHIVPGERGRHRSLLTKPVAVPLEFTTAAFRFGHSMVSASYDYNENFTKDGPGGPAGLTVLLKLTSRGEMAGSENEFGQLPDHWVIDWTRFVRVNAADSFDATDKIDPVISPPMAALSTANRKVIHNLSSIAQRNLRRGFHRFMPSGQAMAGALGIEALSGEDICNAFGNAQLADELQVRGLHLQTPAWAYLLCEASRDAQGNRLGAVASAIVGETIIGILRLDASSVLNAEGGNWTPTRSMLRTKAGLPINGLAEFLQFATEDQYTDPLADDQDQSGPPEA